MQLAQVLHLLGQQAVPARPSRLSAADKELLANILPRAFAAFPGNPFLAREMASFLPASKNTKSLGWLFHRALGVPIGGLTVERAGEEGGTALWRVVLTL